MDQTPDYVLSKILNKIDSNKSIIYSDAGATLSWTYQAANMISRCAPIYTSFNLHAMGYSNCAAIGASINSNKKIFAIIGDGSLPMNSQELAWAKKYPIKLIVIDNKGYGIVRQTQRQFYSSNFLGSDFKNKKASMPSYDLKKILNSFDIPSKELNLNSLNNREINSFLKGKNSKALILKTNYGYEVKT